MGHINFDKQMQTDYKGLIDITDDLGTIFSWNMYKIPIDNKILNWNNYNSTSTNSPVLLKATVNLAETGDTYLDAV
mgnify:CR=1 FL=1|jgi:hypothetical protein